MSQTMNVSMAAYTQAATLYCSQYDVGRVITVNLLDESGDYTIPSGATIKIEATKPSGYGFSESCTWSGSTVTITLTSTMTEEGGRFPAELKVTSGTTVLGSANFLMKVEDSPHLESVEDGDAETAQALTLRVTTLETQVSTNTSDISDLDTRVTALENGSSGSGLTADIKTALLNCFENVAWTSASGQTYYDALEDALYPPANLVSISAVYTQSGTVYDTDTLDSLKTDLVVTAHYDNSTTATVASTDYTLSGTLTEGTSTITVAYGGKTTTFNVTVTHADSSLYNWDFTQSLVDSKQSLEATLSGATQDSSGVTFGAITDYISLCSVSAYNTSQFTVEIDFGTFAPSTNANQYAICLATTTEFTNYCGVFAYVGDNKWAIHQSSNSKKYFSDVSLDTFNNATLKFVYDISGDYVWRVYSDDTLAFEDTAPYRNLNNRIYLGIAFLEPDTVVKAVRVYEGVV